jgi:hypothetical protein
VQTRHGRLVGRGRLSDVPYVVLSLSCFGALYYFYLLVCLNSVIPLCLCCPHMQGLFGRDGKPWPLDTIFNITRLLVLAWSMGKRRWLKSCSCSPEKTEEDHKVCAQSNGRSGPVDVGNCGDICTDRRAAYPRRSG